MNLRTNTIRTINYDMPEAEIALLSQGWRDYVAKIPPYPIDRFTEKGIVYTAGGITYVTCLWVSINALRKTGCTLPVEVWHLGNEISVEVMEKFHALNVEFRNFRDIDAIDKPGFHLKPLAILNSRFQEVLFLDTDNICASNPEYLFHITQYLTTGTIFWPDYWITDKNNPIWKIIDSNDFHLPEQESGQLLVNKRTCWRELNLCLHFNQQGRYYYNLVYGDKDTFKFAWLALKSPFYMIPTLPGICGVNRYHTFLGNTMVQYDPEQCIAFLHRNQLKWDITLSDEKVWHQIKRFKHQAANREVFCMKLTNIMAIDFGGDTECQDIPPILDLLETRCLEYLEDWRNSPVGHRFSMHMHLVNKRYGYFTPFSV